MSFTFACGSKGLLAYNVYVSSGWRNITESERHLYRITTICFLRRAQGKANVGKLKTSTKSISYCLTRYSLVQVQHGYNGIDVILIYC